MFGRTDHTAAISDTGGQESFCRLVRVGGYMSQLAEVRRVIVICFAEDPHGESFLNELSHRRVGPINMHVLWRDHKSSWIRE